MKLRTKVILFVAAIVLILSALVVAYLEIYVHESFKRQILNNLNVVAQENGSTYFAFIKGLKTRALDWSSDNYLKNITEKIIDPTLSPREHKDAVDTFGKYLREKKMQYDKSVLIVDMLDQNGIVIASSRTARIGTNEHEEEVTKSAHYFSKTITAGFGEVFARSVVFEEDETPEPMFHLTTRLFSTKLDAQGKFTPLPAVLLVHFVSLPQLTDLLLGNSSAFSQRSMRVDQGFVQGLKTLEVYLVNNDGLIVTPTRSVKNILEKKHISTKPTEECFNNGKEVKGEYQNSLGVLVVGVSVCLPQDGLVLINEVDVDEAYTLYNDLVQKTIIAGGVTFLLVVFIILLATRRSLRRLDLVVLAAEAVARGDFAVRAPVLGKDEIGYLAQIFNTMLDVTEESKNSLKEAEKKNQEEAVILAQDLEDHKKQEASLEDSKRATLNLLEDSWQAKESLEVEKNRLNTIITSIGEGLIIIDEQYKIILSNPKVVEMFGFLTYELLGKDLRVVVKLWKKRKDEIPVEKWPIEEVFLTKKTIIADLEDDFSITTENHKEHIPIAFSVSPLTGGLRGVVIIFHDVTEDREFDDAKSGFISVASHQLRTPLTTIRWYSEMLLSGDAGELSESQRDFLGEIHGGAERLYQTIDLLLGISRVESGKMKSEKTPLDLTAVTAGIVKELRPQIDEKKIGLTTIPPEGDVVIVVLDSLTLRQVILNLLSNSIRYTNDQGTIEVRWLVNGEKTEVTYSVHDNGIGIPEAQRGRIFSKFFRAENALSKVPDGSGLGLALVKELVESWGGKVWFETTEGQGTTFYFTVPL